jgi:hypothetical protein
MKKVFLAVACLLSFLKVAQAYDVYSSSTPASGTTTGVLCSSVAYTHSYLWGVCVSSPSAGSFTTVYASTFSNTAANNTGTISGATFGCVLYQTQLNTSSGAGLTGMSYSRNGTALFDYVYFCSQ